MQGKLCRVVFFSNGEMIKIHELDSVYDFMRVDRQDVVVEEKAFINPSDMDKAVNSYYR